MTANINPFVINGYASSEYFCDREEESADLISLLINGNNIHLYSPRRMGKTSLILHCYDSPELSGYYTFFADIYATRTLREFVLVLSKAIFNTLKSRGRRALEAFIDYVHSIRPCLTLDETGRPALTMQLGDIHRSETTLDEIFKYLEAADRPCIVAIDEFQQIAGYDEKNMEALLRTYVQRCSNTHFVFAGSQLHTMSMMFLSHSRPFYMSTSPMHLTAIDLEKYTAFAQNHFSLAGKEIQAETVSLAYGSFGGTTWYVQKVLNTLYQMTPTGGSCGPEMVGPAVDDIIGSMEYSFSETVFRLPEKQKEMLAAIARSGEARNVSSAEFVAKHSLPSPSSVQAAVKGLLEKDFITYDQGAYSLCDKFLALWLRRNF